MEGKKGEAITTIILKALAIILLAVVIAAASILIRTGGHDLAMSAFAKQGEESESATAQPGIPEISLQKAKELFDSGKALFLDVRSPEEFKIGRIKGAKNLPYDEYDEKYESVLGSCPPDGPIVTYCSGEGCNSSILLAKRLKEAGFADVSVFYGGWPQWKKAGYPVEELASDPFGALSH